ncbi:MAG TPA: tryptophan synthase subunit beta [Bacteroidales bacterium]|nr:tryptophan synthase subunit beta [Bacteroidales bacterium]
MQQFRVNERGYYGQFGGAFIPEILHRCVTDLREAYLRIMESERFRHDFDQLLRDYVGRPSPLYYSRQLSERYGAKIYLKREDLNHTGAHKINNTIGQILIAREMGKRRIIAETGAGQHGVATATVCALMQMPCVVYMGKTDVERQQVNVKKMEMMGATVVPVTSGNMTLKDATNEAIRDWCSHPDDTHYIIGSTIGPHPYPDLVGRLQSVISKEIKQQLQEKEGRDHPDRLVACVGGGSNAAGTIYEYLEDDRVAILLAEAGGRGVESGESAATIHLGSAGVLHGCRTLLMQTEDGQITEPYSVSAGLDYPGIGPIHAHLADTGRAHVVAITDEEALRAAFELTRREGIIPALESAHALAALEKVTFAPGELVVLTLSGRGDKDLETYFKYEEDF